MNDGGQKKGRREAVEADEVVATAAISADRPNSSRVIGTNLGEIFVCFLWQFFFPAPATTKNGS